MEHYYIFAKQLLLASILIFLLQSLPVLAQSGNIGLTLGLNYSKVSKSDVYYKGVGTKRGLTIGLPIEFYTPNELFSIKSSLLILQKGFDDSEGLSELTLNIWYLQFNLLFTRKFHIYENIKAFVGFGPYGAYAIEGTANRANDIAPLRFGNTISDGDLKPYDAGIKLQSGIEFILPDNRPIVFSLSYYYGVMNINNCKVTRIDNFSNRSFEISLSYFLIPYFKNKTPKYDENEF